MIPIFICEDEEKQRDQMETMIMNYIMIEDLEMVVRVCTDDPYEIINYLEKNPSTQGIYFLDIDLGADINGVELGEKIRQFDQVGKIFIITSHRDLAMMTFEYKLEASDYIVKDNWESVQTSIGAGLLKAQTYFDHKPSKDPRDIITFKAAGRNQTVYLNDIVFLEKLKGTHKILICLTDSVMESTGSLSQLLMKLPENFIQCHQSYIINKNRIDSFNTRTRKIVFDNGDVIHASVSGIKKLNVGN